MSKEKARRGRKTPIPRGKPPQLLTRYRLPLVGTTWVTRNWSAFWALVARGPVLCTHRGAVPVICLSASHYAQLVQGAFESVKLERRFAVLSWLLKTRWQVNPTATAKRRQRK